MILHMDYGAVTQQSHTVTRRRNPILQAKHSALIVNLGRKHSYASHG